MPHSKKVELPTDKHEWHPSPLADQVVLVSTLNEEGTPNVATKSFMSMVAFGPPPILMFGCNTGHATSKNVLKRGEFVINVPSDDLVATSWVVGSDPSTRGSDRFKKHGLTPLPGVKVETPRVGECKAHLECVLDSTKSWGEEILFFGKIVGVTMNADLLDGEIKDRYCKLSPFFFLEDIWASPLGEPRRAVDPKPTGSCGE